MNDVNHTFYEKVMITMMKILMMALMERLMGKHAGIDNHDDNDADDCDDDDND